MGSRVHMSSPPPPRVNWASRDPSLLTMFSLTVSGLSLQVASLVTRPKRASEPHRGWGGTTSTTQLWAPGLMPWTPTSPSPAAVGPGECGSALALPLVHRAHGQARLGRPKLYPSPASRWPSKGPPGPTSWELVGSPHHGRANAADTSLTFPMVMRPLSGLGATAQGVAGV